MIYGVYLSDFIKKQNILLETFNCKQNALEFLENYIHLFILNKEGETSKENFKLRREPSSLKSYTFKNYPFGYFSCYSNESFYKNTIYHKKIIDGYLINSFEIEKILSIDIIEIKKKTNKIKIYNDLLVDQKIENYYNDKVLPELKTYFATNLISNDNI